VVRRILDDQNGRVMGKQFYLLGHRRERAWGGIE
jgi:hypothetical protein